VAKKNPTADQILEAQQMGKRLLLILQFIEDRYGAIGGSAQYRAMIEKAMNEGDRRDLKLLSSDFDEMSSGLKREERDGLEALLQNELGVDLQAERAQLSRVAARSIARGRIASEKERLRLERYLETLELTDGDPAEIAAVRDFLQRA
jgi:hypothetical protein